MEYLHLPDLEQVGRQYYTRFMDALLQQIRSCQECKKNLKTGVNPIIAASESSKIIIIGHAPGRVAHHSGIPWNDKSGENLRSWLGVDKEIFYNPELIALMPMGFCYPGTGPLGDLPPRPECAPLWHHKLLALMPKVELILLIGQYAQNYYLAPGPKSTLTERVRDFNTYLPRFFPLPHPSPRNYIWQAQHKWFEADVLPQLKIRIREIIG